jgi:hypothetical protein
MDVRSCIIPQLWTLVSYEDRYARPSAPPGRELSARCARPGPRGRGVESRREGRGTPGMRLEEFAVTVPKNTFSLGH